MNNGLLALVKLHEGLRLKMYKCTADKWTIGYGLNLESGITEEEASVLLEMRLNAIEKQLEYEFDYWIYLSEVRQAVLLDMAYNLGVEGLMNFKDMVKAINTDDFIEAAEEILDSKYAKDVGKRAIRLSNMMRLNEWSSDITFMADKPKIIWLNKLLDLFK